MDKLYLLGEGQAETWCSPAGRAPTNNLDLDQKAPTNNLDRNQKAPTNNLDLEQKAPTNNLDGNKPASRETKLGELQQAI